MWLIPKHHMGSPVDFFVFDRYVDERWLFFRTYAYIARDGQRKSSHMSIVNGYLSVSGSTSWSSIPLYMIINIAHKLEGPTCGE